MTSGGPDSIQGEAEQLSNLLLQTNAPGFEMDELLILRSETSRRTIQYRSYQRPISDKQRQELSKPGKRTAATGPRMVSLIRRRLRFPRVEPGVDPLHRGREALESGNFDIAMRSFSERVAENPEDADAWIGLARSRFLAFDNDGAMVALTHVFEIRPTSNKGYFIRAQVHRSRGDFELARQDLWRLVAKNLTDVAILSDILDEVIGMELYEDVALIADAILDIDVDNDKALSAKVDALSKQSGN